MGTIGFKELGEPVGVAGGSTGSATALSNLDGRHSSSSMFGTLPTLGAMSGNSPATAGGRGQDASNSSGTSVVTPSRSALAIEDDPELREKEKLLAEIQTIRRNIDALRLPTSTGISALDNTSPSASTLPHVVTDFRHRPIDSTFLDERSPPPPPPVAHPPSPKSEWDEYLAKRTVIRPSSAADYRGSSPLSPSYQQRRSDSFDGRPSAVTDGRRSSVLSMQGIMEGGGAPRQSMVSAVEREFGVERLADSDVRSVPHRRFSTYTMAGNDSGSFSPRSPGVDQPASFSSQPTPPRTRTLSQSELSARHRAQIVQMEQPVREQFAAAEARERWDLAREREREEMRVREREARRREEERSERRRRSEISVEGWRSSVVLDGADAGDGRRDSSSRRESSRRDSRLSTSG